MTKIYFAFLFCFSISGAVSAQVTITQQQYICNTGDCATLLANYTDSRDTSDYIVTPIAYNPFSYYGGTLLPIPANTMNQDDFWATSLELPFSFCFYGIPYSKVQCSTNGILSFDSDYTPGDFSDWLAADVTFPSPDFRLKNAIYGVYQDLDFDAGNAQTQNINFYVLDTGIYAAPNRIFVFNINHIPNYRVSDPGNTSGLQTSQIVLHETSNIIDVNVERRVGNLVWESGVGLIGIQNVDGTKSAVPPGRGIGSWSAYNESYRFSPSGESNINTVWTLNGEVVGTGNTINACLSSPIDHYSVSTTLTRCEGTQIVSSADYDLTGFAIPGLSNPVDLTFCVPDAAPVIIDLTQNESFILAGNNPLNHRIRYYHTLAGAVYAIPAARIIAPQSYAANLGVTGIYVRIEEIFGIHCPATRIFSLIGTSPATTPQGSGMQTFSPGQTLNDLNVTGTNIVWYDTQTGGNLLSGTTLLQHNFTYYAENSNEGCPTKQAVAERLAVTVQSNLDTNIFDRKSLKIYPNPTDRQLTISYPENLNQIDIYNSVGQLILSKNPAQAEIKIDVSNLNPGVYFIKLSLGYQTTTAKFIKN